MGFFILHSLYCTLYTLHILAYWFLTNILEVNIVHFANEETGSAGLGPLVNIMQHLEEVELQPGTV